MNNEALRIQFTKSALASCRHFNGVQNKACEAGVTYEREGSERAMPCIPRFINGRATWPCDRFEIMSQAEAEQEADGKIISMERGLKARCAAKDHAKSLGLGKGKGGHSAIPCPGCDGGTLRYSVASYNGHMHARCTTAGCVSWME